MSERSRIQNQDHAPDTAASSSGERMAAGANEVFENWPQIQEVARNTFSEMLQQRDEHGKPMHSREELADSTAFYQFVVNLQRSHPQLRIPEHQLSELNKFLRMDLLGLGVLDLYLADPEVEDIFLDRWDTLDIIKGGVKTRIAQPPFESDQAVFQWLQARVFAPINKDFNRSNPSENAVLPDGSRLIAVTQPISPYTAFAVRRHRKEVFQTTTAYMQTQIAPEAFFQDLQRWVSDCRNMIISGATGSGKTTFINVAASLIPENERLLTLEDTPELQIQHPRVKPMYTFEKGARAGETGERDIPMSDLLRYALRMKPDRIIIGEVRDRETFDMLDALNTGHAGSFTTLHSNSPVDALTRLQMMSSRHPARGNLEGSTLQDLIASVIDIIVQIRNFNGTRRVVGVEQIIYGPHYAERPETFQEPGMRRIYPNLFLRPLWRWNGSILEKTNDFLPPDHA